MKYLITVICSVLFVILGNESQGQSKDKIVQFSGIIVGADSTSGVAGVHIFVPKGGRGTTTNPYGYFSMPVLENDSLIISAVGYEKTQMVIPVLDKTNYTVVIELQQDTTYLPEIEVYPFMTEEVLKEAILAFNLPYQHQYSNMRQSLDQAMLNKMFKNLPQNAGGNYNQFLSQQQASYNSRFQTTSIPLLNPFAWREFIKSLKKNKEKKK